MQSLASQPAACGVSLLEAVEHAQLKACLGFGTASGLVMRLVKGPLSAWDKGLLCVAGVQAATAPTLAAQR